MKIMGDEVIIIDKFITKTENVETTLYGSAEGEKFGIIQLVDKDVEEIIGTTRFPIFENAKAEYLDIKSKMEKLENNQPKENKHMPTCKNEISFQEAIKNGNKWSGGYQPETGQKVLVDFNSLGTGTIEGFFTEHEWIGILVKPDNPPEWWKKQNPDRKHYMVFGAETTHVQEKIYLISELDNGNAYFTNVVPGKFKNTGAENEAITIGHTICQPEKSFSNKDAENLKKHGLNRKFEI